MLLVSSAKGLTATNIVIQEEKSKSSFIQLGDTRIKINNIKNYGVSTETFFFQKVYDVIDTTHTAVKLLAAFGGISMDSWEYQHNNNTVQISEEDAEDIKNNRRWMLIFPVNARNNESAIYFIEGRKVHFSRSKHAAKDDLIIDKIKYLYVTTYQNDNYKFYEGEITFDIKKKCNELDELLS